MKQLCPPIIVIMLFAGVLLSAGCSTPPETRYYTLSPIKDVSQRAITHDRACPAIGIGVIKLPRYLDRPQITTSIDDTEILLSEENRWAEPLSSSFPRVLARNLCGLMCTSQVVIYPWRTSVQPDYIVDVEVMRLEGAPGGNVHMDVRWWVSRTGESPAAWGSSQMVGPAKGTGYEGLVKAHSKVIGDLSMELSKAIQGMSRGSNTGK